MVDFFNRFVLAALGVAVRQLAPIAEQAAEAIPDPEPENDQEWLEANVGMNAAWGGAVCDGAVARFRQALASYSGLADGDDWDTYQLGKLAVREALHRLMDDRRN